MPVESADVPQFVSLAERLRKETYGCKTWDRHGSETVFARELVGMNFRTALELVIAHSCDSEAKTPAAIRRPFKPEPVEPPAPRLTAETQCPECNYYVPGQCHPTCPTKQRVEVEPLPDPKAAARANIRTLGQTPKPDAEDTP